MDVSRETILRDLAAVGIEEDAAHLAAPRLEALCEILAEGAVPMGFLGPREAERIWERHVLDGAKLHALLNDPRGAVIDVGSGAGLPGLAMACLRTGPTVLLDAIQKRAAFAEDVARTLGLAHVRVVSDRAETLAHDPDHREKYDFAVSRALAQPPVALELMLPFVKIDGAAVILAGESAAISPGVESAATELGNGDATIVEVTGATAPSWCIMVRKRASTPVRYPRRPGIPAKRPL